MLNQIYLGCADKISHTLGSIVNFWWTKYGTNLAKTRVCAAPEFSNVIQDLGLLLQAISVIASYSCRQELLDDIDYIGLRHKRVTGEAYDEFIDEFMAVSIADTL